MIVLTAEALKKHIDSIPGIRSYKRRFCYDEVRNLVVNTRDFKVVALYGLIKTGKKTLMAQLIMDIGQYDNICLIKCTEGDGIRDLFDVIDKHEDCEYFFIEEAARLKNFSMEGFFLADYYSMDHRIIMSASDSLAFYLARIDNFFDRMHTIHTTYISYKEYNYLLGRNLDDYIQHGGTLTPGDDFWNSKTTRDYSFCAIGENMVHSLEDLGKRGSYGTLSLIRGMNNLATFVYMITERYNLQFAIQALRHCFWNNKDIVNDAVKDTVSDELSTIADMSLYDRTSTTSLFRVFGKNEILQATARTNEYLKALDVIYYVPYSDELIFTQPGYRYNQCADMIDILMKKLNTAFSDEQLKELTMLLENEIRSRMLEDIVWHQLLKAERLKEFYTVRFLHHYVAGEAALLLGSMKENEACIIRLSFSEKAEDIQALTFSEETLCKYIWHVNKTTIIGKLGLYMGETLKEKQHGASIVNIEEFLMYPEKFLDMVLPHKKKPAFCPPWGSYLEA